MKTGRCCYWRHKRDTNFKFGYISHVSGNLYRMGRWNGDTAGGSIVDASEVEVRYE